MKKYFLTTFIALSSSLLAFLSAQNISTVAGNNAFGAGYSGDGGVATNAELSGPNGVAIDASGNMYIADATNNVIRKVDHSTGSISTIAGNYLFGPGFSGDGGKATAAELHAPASIAFDALGNLIIADADNNVIRMVDYSTGNISTIAGNNTAGYSGDGGPATAAELKLPTCVYFDGSGNMDIADYDNYVIRSVDHSSGTISTIAGNHIAGYFGDGGPATVAELNGPSAIFINHSTGDLYIAEYNSNVIRKVQNGTGNISTYAGIHALGFSGDGGPANSAELAHPWGITMDGLGNLFISDQFNNLVREVYSSNGNIGTIAGNYADGFGYSGDGGPATNAELYAPAGITLDATGNLFIADNNNNVIREVNSVTIGINEISSLANDVNIYPNPGNGEFIVSLGNAELFSPSQTKVEIYNVMGEKIYSTSNILHSELNIDLSQQPNGVYFVQITNREGSISRKIVIER